jgi:hypothetical protein
VNRIIIPTLALAFIVAACSSSHQGGSEGSDTAASATAPAKFRGDTSGRDMSMNRTVIGARSCRIVGVVTAIDPTPRSNNPDHPTAKYPSIATVRVDSVLLTGERFSSALVPGQSVTVTFAYTLNPTEGIVPNLRKEYPGLRVDSRFQADIIDRGIPAGKSDRDFATTPLVIFDYHPL